MTLKISKSRPYRKLEMPLGKEQEVLINTMSLCRPQPTMTTREELNSAVWMVAPRT